ncbi:hypothetical protein CRE_09535 [Caenorhabditis remanei]|uniref:Uncharacterized protein n=1 Tax=Caenorhabditis remanei TaxID=31234 RepID=E3MJ18_CAERE|nr:hypothetical protein CRE_09535 [Caenorhabditis remanei]
MNSSDKKPQLYDPRPRSEIMSSDNYEVPQIVKPAVAVSPVRDKEPTRGVRQSNRGIRGCDHRVEILGLPIYPDSSDEEEEKKLLTRGAQLVHWPFAKEASRLADETKRGYDSPSNHHKPRIGITRLRHHHRNRWIHQSEPRKPHHLEEFGGYPAVINTQQKKSASETEEVRRNPIRKALKPQ